MKRDVVILAGGIGSTYSICKNLKKKFGVSVYLIFINETYAKLFRKNCYVTEAVDWEIDSAASFMERVKKWYAVHSFGERPVLYSTSDESCVLVAHDRQWFEERFILTLPSDRIIHTFNDKEKSSVAVQETFLKYPKTCIITSETRIQQVVDSFSFPVIIKPFDFNALRQLGFKVQVFNDVEGFYRTTSSLLSHHLPLLVQEYIPGGDDKLWFYMFYRGSNGSFQECMGRKIVQHPAGRGIMAVGRTVRDERLSSTCRHFLAQIDYTGIGGIEFKEYNGEFYFIEMSTRSEGFIKMSEAAGSFIPAFAYVAATSSETIVCEQQLDGRLYVDAIIYTLECLKSRQLPFVTAVVNEWFRGRLAVNPYPLAYMITLLKTLFKRMYKR